LVITSYYRQEEFYNREGKKIEKLEFQIGIAEWEGGKTTLQIIKDGHVLVKNEYRGTIKQFQKKLPENIFIDLVTTYNKNKISEIKQKREFGIPDESMIHLITYTNGQKTEISLWENEARENEQFSPLLNQIESIIKDVSKGEIH
jgi:hypothetical protein